MQQQVDQFSNTIASIQITPTVPEKNVPEKNVPEKNVPEKNISEEWAALFHVGNEIATQPSYGPKTMTQIVTTMRR